MALKRNLIANYLGQGWTALMGLAFIPLYIRCLGIEAYGLVGLFAALQVWLGLLDMGLTPALGREMARFTGGGHTAQSIRDLLRSVEAIAGGMLLLIVAGGAAASDWVARHWLQVENIPVGAVAQALVIMALVIALRLLEGVYRSSIVGLQQQVLLNLVSSLMATLRWLGAVGVLAWVSPTVEAFFIWQGLSSLATIGLLAFLTYRLIPAGGRRARLSWHTLRGVWGFAGGMMGITFLVILLTQVDKIILSRLLALSDYGYYTLASTVAGGLYTLISPISQALYPRLCELHTRQDDAALIEVYHTGAQLVSVIAGSAALVILMFSDVLLGLWTQDVDIAQAAGPLLSILIFGNLLNSMMWIPYQAQLAHGWTRHAVHANSIAVLFVVPAIVWATPRYGALGAAWVWVALNTGYVLISIQFMYRRILQTEKWRWYWHDIAAPLLPAALAVYGIKVLLSPAHGAWIQLLALGAAALVALLVSAMFASRVRAAAVKVIQSIIRRPLSAKALHRL